MPTEMQTLPSRFVKRVDTPGGELGGTYETPTVDPTHSGSPHSSYLPLAGGDVSGPVILDNTIPIQARTAGAVARTMLHRDVGSRSVFGNTADPTRIHSSGNFDHNNGVTTAAIARIATGVYTGDGAVSQAITGLGFAPKYLKIWVRATGSGVSGIPHETTDSLVDNHANGLAFYESNNTPPTSSLTDAIIAVGADGFTVDDAGADSHPNKNAQVYEYLAIG